jgi:Fibronectin type III-like domain
VTVRDTGPGAGAAVPQLCMALPSSTAVPEPPEQLRGYAHVDLQPGQSAEASFPLNDRAFAYWDDAAGDWSMQPGCYGIAVGSSSAQLPLHATVGRLGASCGPGALSLTAPDDDNTAPVLSGQPAVKYLRAVSHRRRPIRRRRAAHHAKHRRARPHQ